MDIKYEYYMSKYEELSILSDKEKSKIILIKNIDTGELAVKREMKAEAYKIYGRLKSINCSNIPKVYECFSVEDKCIVIEEFVNGKRLDILIKERNLLAYRAVNLVIQLCNALSVVHRQGIIHRDINPRNIIVTSDEVLKLIDFDIAREEKDGAIQDTTVLGTAGYAAPEQFGFSQTSARSDIYAIGVLLRTMITGQENGDLESAKNAIWNQNTDTDFNRLRKIINKCTQMDSQNRYASVDELSIELAKSINKEVEIEEIDGELPKITPRYILKTIPGFRRGNAIFSLLAILCYGIYIWACVNIGWGFDLPTIRKIYAIFMYFLLLAVPYAYLVNIGHIAQRFPKMKFKSKSARISYQICVAFILMMIIAVIMALTLPIQKS